MHTVAGIGQTRTGIQIGSDQVAAFANSAAANTNVNIDLVKPEAPKARYMISIYNPSTVTDLTIKVFNTGLSLGGGTRYAYLDTITVPKKATYTGTLIDSYAKEVEGIFNGMDARLVVSNDTVLGGSDGFSAYIRIRECF